jgi:hypothetical protein
MSEPVKPAWGVETLEAPKEFARVTSLGAFEKIWLQSSVRYGVVFMIIGAILTAVGGVMALVSGSPWAFIPFGFFGVLFLVIGLFSGRRPRHTATLAATFHEGFAALVASNVSLWPWDEIKTIVTKTKYRGGTSGRTGYNLENHWIEVSKQGGETVVILDTEMKDVDKLVTTIKDRVRARLLPPLQESYDAGRTLTFGPIRVSTQRLEADKHRLDWSAIRNVVVTDGSLVVNPKEGEPFKIRVSSIPNVDLLCALIGVKYTRTDLAYRW